MKDYSTVVGYRILFADTEYEDGEFVDTCDYDAEDYETLAEATKRIKKLIKTKDIVELFELYEDGNGQLCTGERVDLSGQGISLSFSGAV